jgi:4,5:9,10-diseco-3-hydroxy-5,9,17-trioxoandrosta-1(10),2-diene-4-oate hydrolase
MNAVASMWRTFRLGPAGDEIAVFETGSRDPHAPAVLLVHGLGHWTEGAWERIIPYLDPRLRIVAFDLPGFGSSDRPDAAYDDQFFAGAMTRVVAATMPARFALVGHSLGGAIAARYAAAHPEQLSRLVLIAPAGFLRGVRYVYAALGTAPIQWLMHRRPSRRTVRWIKERTVADPSVIAVEMMERAYELAEDPGMRRAFARVYATALRELAHADEIEARLHAWNGPTLLAWGRKDALIPLRGLDDAARVYPQAEVVIFPWSGHVPMLEEPTAFGTRLNAFLAQDIPQEKPRWFVPPFFGRTARRATGT